MDYPSDTTIGLYGGKFTDGDPELAIAASRDPASHMNAITDEILSVIAAFGLTPDEADLTQLLQAFQAATGGLRWTPPINIGDWDMDTDAAVVVPHSVDITKIRKVTAMLRNDGGTILYSLPYVATSAVEAWVEYINATSIQLTRNAGGIFDASGFSTTSYNRGWVMIGYTL